MTLRQKILLLGVFAVLGMLLALWLQYRSYSGQVRAMEAIKRNVGAVEALSRATHELQKERGLTAINAAAKPDGRLPRQTQESDAALDQLAEAGVETTSLRASLSKLRSAVAGGTMAPLAAQDAYTAMLQGLIDEMDRLTREPEVAVAKTDIAAHAHLVAAKEYLGRVRATLGHWIERGGEAHLALQSLVRVKSIHEEELRKFTLEAAPELRDILAARFAGDDVGKMQRMLARVLVTGELPQDLGAAEWFSLATTAIDRLKAVEDESLRAIAKKADDGIARLQQAMRMGALVTLGSGIVVLVLAFSATASLLRALDRALRGMERISESKDFSSRIPADSSDEIGRISRSFNELLDIAERLLREKECLAQTDMLTGIHNRLSFAQTLQAEAERKRRNGTAMSLVMFDVDHFKRINDTHGHNAGDDVLRHLTKLVGGETRATDFFGRWGGEEFVLLLRDEDCQAAMAVAEKIRGAIAAAQFPAVGKLTCSFGVASWERDDSEAAFVARADRGLYDAKRLGRNRVCCGLMGSQMTPDACPGRGACAAH